MRAPYLHLPFLCGICLTLAADVQAAPAQAVTAQGRLEYDILSNYSHIRIRRMNNMRTMIFVRDTQQEVAETAIDLNLPHRLLFEYTQFMFTSYLYRESPQNVAIVGLGGGAMVHFLRHYDPAVKIDAVEIDPAVIKIAADWFGVKPDEGLNILAQDALTYFDGTKQYDVIYMDAFLKPTAATDGTGVPLELKTQQYFDSLKRSLTEGGVVVFNINAHLGIDRDLLLLRQSFPQTYVFRLSGGSGAVVVATSATQRESFEELRRRARLLDQRFKATFSFARMVNALR